MINEFASLPIPAVGVGAEVDVSKMGRIKTLTVQGGFSGAIAVEFSCGGEFVTAATFSKPGNKKIEIAAKTMRVVARGGDQPQPGGPAFVEVASDNAGAKFASLIVNGPSVNVEEFGTFNTVVVGSSGGRIHIQISEDDVAWLTQMTFAGNETNKSAEFTAKYMRAIGAQGIPVCVGAINDMAAVVSATDELVKITAADTVAAYLADKIVAGDRISLNVLNPGADEDLEISAIDEFVKVTGADTVASYLADKVAAGSGVALQILNPGADEDLEISVSGADASNIDTGPPITVRGAINAEGASLELSRADHDHRLELEVQDEGALTGARPIINFVGVGVTATDNGPEDRVDIVIPGTSDGGANVSRTLYTNIDVSTTSASFVDAMSGSSIIVPVNGDYWAIFEGEGENQSASAVMELGVSVNSLVAVVVNSERISQGPAADIRPVITTAYLPGLTAGDLVRTLFRRVSGAGSVKIYRKRLTIFLVQ